MDDDENFKRAIKEANYKNKPICSDLDVCELATVVVTQQTLSQDILHQVPPQTI